MTAREPSWGDMKGSRHERGYGSDWTRLRLKILKRDNYMCVNCKRQGIDTPLKVRPYDHAVDHIMPKAFGGTDHPDNLQSLCAPCHDQKTYAEQAEARGSRSKPEYDNRGFPVWREIRQFGHGIPDGLEPAAVPVHLIFGPPAAGKTTYVETHKDPGDIVIDLDQMKAQVGGKFWDTDPLVFHKAMQARNGALHALRHKQHGKAYVIVTGPTQQARDAWKAALGPKATQTVLDTPEDTCIARIEAEPERKDAKQRQIQAVRQWHKAWREEAR